MALLDTRPSSGHPSPDSKIDDTQRPERRRRFGVVRQLRVALPLFEVWSVGTLTLCLALLGDEIPDERLLLSPSTIANLPWYTGLISNLGISAWTVAAVCTAAGAFVVSLDPRRHAVRFSTHLAMLSGLLALDDMLRLRSDLLPQTLGVSKLGALAEYLALSWCVGHYHKIRRTPGLLLHSAGAALIAFVVFGGVNVGGVHALIVKDATKFLGTLVWATYLALTSVDTSRSVLARHRR